MINYLKIDHFKAFLGTVEMAIDDKNVLIFGENGSGKSSIYQALKLIFHKQKIFDSKIPKTITDPNERKRHENDILASYNHQQSPLTGFTIEINNTTYDTFSTVGYDVSMISQEDIQVEDKINVVDLFGKAMVGIVNPTDFINNKKDTIVSLVNSFLKDYFFEGNLSVELVYENPSWFLQVTDISRGNLTRNEELTAFFNEAKLHIIKLLLLLTAIQFNGAKERRESLILVLDDVITSMDAANRTLFIRLLKDFFEDYQLIVLTHSISFFNLTNYSFSIAYQQKDKWKLFQIIEHEGNSEVIDREPQDFASLINKDFKAGQSLGIVGNRIRKRFEFLVSEVASVLYTGGIVESTHLLKTITDKKKIYCEYVGAKKKPHTVYELVDELTAIIDTAPPSPLKSQLDSVIARYTSGTEIAKLKDVLSDLSIYQKVSMHPLSHATGALSLSTQAEVDRSITLWVTCFEVVEGTQETCVSNIEFRFDAPMVFPEKKDESSCRPLCKFTNLEDSVIIILANKYLTELFNNQFYDESLAFRSKRTYHGQKDYVTSHHDAIARIKEYRKQMSDRNLYVSECDLKKFYDTVSHNVVRKCYHMLLRKVAKENPGLQFDEINRVFEAYLRCYTFPKNVYCKNHCPDFWEENHIDGKCRSFKWVKDELLDNGIAKSQSGLMRMGIGVPQGGALSGLIANMVLNSVDHEVMSHTKENDLYLRYCDDMIIVSTCRQRCHKLFFTYYNGAKKLKLVPHEPEKRLEFNNPKFWKSKSKNAYLWAMGQTDAAEWIGFVGYEMRRDGMIRIRHRSFRKELDKQKSVVFEKVLDKINGKDRVSDGSLYGSLERKLVSMSVGKVAVWNAKFMESEMCWTDGFRELEMNPVLSRQLHELDRHRGMMLSAAAKRIKKMKDKGEILKRKDVEQLDDEKNPDSRGMVHSYYYQFTKKNEA